MRYGDRQYCAFMSFKCCLSSLAAALLAGCAFKVRTLPSILLRMVFMCALHLAIFLEICGAVAFLHSLLMSVIIVSDKFADAILVFCLRSNLLRLLTCVAVQRLPVCLLGCLLSLRLLGRLFTYVWYFQFVSYKSLSGCAMLCSQIPILRRTLSFGIKHVLSVNTIRILVCI